MMKKILSLILAFSMIFILAACGNSETSPNGETGGESGNVSGKTDSENSKRPELTINKTPSQILAENLVDYTDPNGLFTAKIPEGWLVSTAGYDMYYWIRIYDPAAPDLQVFSLLKAECLLMDQNSKDFYESMRSFSLYTMFADMIVVEKVEDFYSNFMEYCGFMTQYEPTYEGFEYPQINDFEVIEKTPGMSVFSDVSDAAIDDAVIHGTFTDNWTGEKGEGMFTGTLVNGFAMNGAGCNMMYNINALTSRYGEFCEYEELLTDIFASISYTDTFVSTVMQDAQIKAAGAQALNQTLQETSSIITDGWEARQKTYDIESQKYSDATLGYERVYDVETGEIYKAYNGFSDITDIDDYYLPVTDEMYSEPISGYIER